jgi:thiol-disulfide isomerase/thioredoxin
MFSGGSFCDWFSGKNLLIAISVLLILSILSMPSCTEYMADLVRDKPNLEFAFYSMTNCGYCTPVRPIWEELTRKFKNNGKFVLKHYDTSTHAAEIEAAGIKGFPTIRAIKNGIVIDTFSEGQRNESNISSWITAIAERN